MIPGVRVRVRFKVRFRVRFRVKFTSDLSHEQRLASACTCEGDSIQEA
jgi:hypothetical protein